LISSLEILHSALDILSGSVAERLPFHLAPLGEEDVDAALRIDRMSFRRPWGRLSFMEELSAHGAIGLVVRAGPVPGGDEIAAYICCRLVMDEIHILRLAVAPGWHRRGFAAFLLAEALETARRNGAVEAFLEVRSSNLAALSLYRKIGFCVAGKRPSYYPDNREDALILKKKLKEA
jgi:ribosomal-protein-alanine N-acetyltransferase